MEQTNGREFFNGRSLSHLDSTVSLTSAQAASPHPRLLCQHNSNAMQCVHGTKETNEGMGKEALLVRLQKGVRD